MNIYIPYTYLIGWSKHNKFYYGRRTAKNCHPNEFWKTYFTSSKHVKQFRKENGEPDIIQIRKIFPDNPTACRIWECKVLERLDAQHHSKFLNEKNGDHKWDTTGMVSVKDENDNTFLISNKDPKYLSGELISIQNSLEHKEKLMKYWNENFQVVNPFQLETIKQKSKETILRKYGVDNISKNSAIKRKKEKTLLNNFQVDNPSKSPIIKQKKKETSIINYGVEHHSKIEKLCPYCNTLNKDPHEKQCTENPNRTNPSFKTFKILSPKNEIFIINNGLRLFCEEKNISYGSLKLYKKTKGWILLD